MKDVPNNTYICQKRRILRKIGIELDHLKSSCNRSATSCDSRTSTSQSSRMTLGARVASLVTSTFTTSTCNRCNCGACSRWRCENRQFGSSSRYSRVYSRLFVCYITRKNHIRSLDWPVIFSRWDNFRVHSLLIFVRHWKQSIVWFNNLNTIKWKTCRIIHTFVKSVVFCGK